MSASYRFFKAQKLQNIGLKQDYISEARSYKVFQALELSVGGQAVALYHSDYLTLLSSVGGEEQLTRLSAGQVLSLINKQQLRLIRYFSPEALNSLELDILAFNEREIFKTISGVTALVEAQNCLVMIDNKIYMHPKVRPNPKKRLLGVSHSSLSCGAKVQFAGSFSFDTTKRCWVLENTTGHYGTWAIQMRHFVNILAKKGMDLSALTIKLWVPNDCNKLSADEHDFHIHYENAECFAARVNHNREALESKAITAAGDTMQINSTSL